MTDTQQVFTDEQLAVSIRYRNHRGEISVRRVVPFYLHFTGTPWHVGKQWIMEARDVGKGGAMRSFALKDVLEWLGPGVAS